MAAIADIAVVNKDESELQKRTLVLRHSALPDPPRLGVSVLVALEYVRSDRWRSAMSMDRCIGDCVSGTNVDDGLGYAEADRASMGARNWVQSFRCC